MPAARSADLDREHSSSRPGGVGQNPEECVHLHHRAPTQAVAGTREYSSANWFSAVGCAWARLPCDEPVDVVLCASR